MAAFPGWPEYAPPSVVRFEYGGALAMKVDSDVLAGGIERRWEATADQVADTAAAVQQGKLHLANTVGEIDERRARLSRQGLELEGIIDQDDSVWLSFFSRGLTASRAVGRVVRAPKHQPVTPVGTGVLISARLLLTNNHVVPDPDEATGMCVELGYEFNDDGKERRFDTCQLDPAACWFTDEELDFTVVAVTDLRGKAPGEKYGAVPLIEQTGKVLKGETLNVIHHPGGDRKRVSIRENRMVAEDELWLRYTSDTRAGSSGAPVFNDQWEMVALHHGGVARRDAAGNRLSRTGQPWTRDMGDDAVAYLANEGARVSRVVRRLKAAKLDGPGSALVNEAGQQSTGQ